MGQKNTDQRRWFWRRRENTRSSPPPEEPKKGSSHCIRCSRQRFAVKGSDYCREHQPFWERIRLIRFVVRVCSAASALSRSLRVRVCFTASAILASKVVQACFARFAISLRSIVAHWRGICRILIGVGLVVLVAVLVATGLKVLAGWLSVPASIPTVETPAPSPTKIPPTETPVVEATPTEALPTLVPQGDFIPDSVVPGGMNSPEVVLAIFNGEEVPRADGCPAASREYMEAYFGGDLPVWEEIEVVSELPELPEGVAPEGRVYRLHGRGGEEGWLVLGTTTLTSQIACRQDSEGAEVYINNRVAPDELVWVVLWGNGNAAIFRVACGNFALVKGTLPPPEKEATPTPTEVPTETPTATPTGSPTPSPSVTPTPTGIPSPTPTSTPVTPTPTPTRTPTSTPTSTPTATPTWTPTVTSTPTSTPTPTPTSTPTPVVEYGGTAGVRWTSCDSSGYRGEVTASAWKLINGVKVAEGQITIEIGPYPPCSTASGSIVVPLSDEDSHTVGWQATTTCPPTPTPEGPTPTPLPTPAPTETPPDPGR